MNLWILVAQSTILAFVFVQYNFVKGGQARIIDYSADGWLTGFEKKLNGVMETRNRTFSYMFNNTLTHNHSGSSNITRGKRELNKIHIIKNQEIAKPDYLKNQHVKDTDVFNMFKGISEESSDMSKERADPDIFSGSTLPEHTEEDGLQHLTKKKNKKYKKFSHDGNKIKPKSGHHSKKRNNKKKSKAPVAKKFVKAKENLLNMSDSNESLRRDKPVDIIVHIKMNE